MVDVTNVVVEGDLGRILPSAVVHLASDNFFKFFLRLPIENDSCDSLDLLGELTNFLSDWVLSALNKELERFDLANQCLNLCFWDLLGLLAAGGGQGCKGLPLAERPDVVGGLLVLLRSVELIHCSEILYLSFKQTWKLKYRPTKLNILLTL